MRGPYAIVVLSIAGVACGSADMFLGTPDGAGRSLLVAVEGVRPTYYAADAAGALNLPVAGDEDVVLRAALLSESLESLGLAAGEVSSSVGQNVRPLPDDTTYFRTSIAGGVAAGWTPSGDADVFATFRVGGSPTLAANCAVTAVEGTRREDERPFGAPVAMPGGALLIRSFGGYRIIDADRASAPLTVTATTSLIPKLVDETGVFFTDPRGQLWWGEIVLRGDRREVTPTRYRLDPPTRVETIIAADGPGRYVIANSEFTGLIDDRRFVPSFDYDGNVIHAARTDDGRTFVSVGINLTELIDDRLEFRSIVGGIVLGLHFDPAEGLILLRRAGADAGVIARWDPDLKTIDDRHVLAAEGALLASLQTARGISYLVSGGDGPRTGAIYNYVPGFGACGEPLVRGTGPIRYLVAIGGAVTGIGGDSGDVFLFVDPPR